MEDILSTNKHTASITAKVKMTRWRNLSRNSCRVLYESWRDSVALSCSLAPKD
jgi:hypothetical protein